MKHLKALSRIVFLLLVLVVCAEIGVRTIGLTDFPIYRRQNGVEYYLAPNQNGKFLMNHRWFVNHAGFNNIEETNWDSGCMLIGDSVVYGGNPVTYEKRVGSLASAMAKKPVWVLAAGGWNLVNELFALQRYNRELRPEMPLVFVLNNGDFGKRGLWSGELAFPTHRPSFALWYLASRYVFGHESELPNISHNLSADRISWTRQLDDLIEHHAGPVSIILYADKDALKNRDLFLSSIRIILDYNRVHGGKLHVVSTLNNWSESLYRDNVHPNNEGNRILARYVADAC